MVFEGEHRAPGAGGPPHLVALHQVEGDEHAQVGPVPEGRNATDGLCIRSAAERFDERFCLDPCLAKYPTQRPSLDLTMERHNAASGTATQHHMTPPLSDDDEAEALQGTDSIRARNVREFRQRRRCGTW